MNNKYDLHLVAVVEKGYLEHQLKLLILSVKQFLEPFLSVKIIAVSPRKNKQPNKKYISFLHQNNVDFIDIPLNKEHDFFPLCNGIYASDFVARTYNHINNLLLVDTDTLFLNPIEDKFLQSKSIYMRAVDNKGIGSTGSKDSNNIFWDEVFEFFKLKPLSNKILTTVSQELIRPYFNSGFIMINKNIDFMQQWKKDFVKLMNSKIRTDPSNSRHLVDYGFIEQMVISVTIEKMSAETNLLPQTYNYPIPFRPKIKNRPNHPKFNELVHVHYHKWFQHPGFLDYVTDDEEKKSEQYLWLKEHLPLLPEIGGDFKC